MQTVRSHFNRIILFVLVMALIIFAVACATPTSEPTKPAASSAASSASSAASSISSVTASVASSVASSSVASSSSSQAPTATKAPEATKAPVSSSSASAASAAPTRGGNLRVAVAQLPTALDPVVSTLGTQWAVAQQVCEGLTAVDNNWQIQPMLAKSFSYDDKGTTLTFKLRTDVKFHDGSVMTADDVVASLQRFAQSAGVGSTLKAFMTDLKATDAETVVITLSSPNPTIPGLLTYPPASIMPKKSVGGRAATDAVSDLVCTGPYKVTQFQPDRQVVMTRFADYVPSTGPTSGSAGKKNAYADTITFLPMAEASVRRDSLITGAVDVAGLPFDFYDAVKANSSLQPYLIKSYQSLTMLFNTKQGPTANAKLRQAIYYALDMDEIMLAAEGNRDFYALDPSWVPDTSSIWYTTVGADGFGKSNPAKVKQLLQEANYKGEVLRWLTSKDYPTWYLPAQTIQQQLDKYGIKVDLQVSPATTVTQKRTDPTQFEIFSSFLPTYIDPTNIPYLQGTFPGFWTDPKKEDMLKQLGTTIDPKARLKIWQDLHTYIYQEMPWIKFGTESVFIVSRKGVTGVEVSPANPSVYYNVALPAK